MKVVITGGTGFVGKVIIRQLLASGHEVVVITRNVAKAAISLGSSCQYFQWDDVNAPAPAEAFEGSDGVINLMGASISQKWDEEHKKEIHDSRIIGTRSLVETLKNLKNKPKVLVSTSAVGIYGNRVSENLNENSTVADDFLGSLCREWENEAEEAVKNAVRVVIIRTGVVLGRGGGALKKMLPIFKLGVGGPVGTGKQFMSWIHIEDLAAMYIEALKNDSMVGVFNGTAPYPATNADFTKEMGKVLRRPAVLPAPAFAMKLAFGEMSQILLEGQKVLPDKFKEFNFRYRYPTLEMALKETAY